MAKFLKSGSGKVGRNACTRPEVAQRMTDERSATLHRMVLSDHVCPFGVRAKSLLEAHGYAVDDRHLTTREEVEAFKEEHGLRTTPLVFIGEERVGGCDDLERRLKG